MIEVTATVKFVVNEPESESDARFKAACFLAASAITWGNGDVTLGDFKLSKDQHAQEETRSPAQAQAREIRDASNELPPTG